MATEYEDVTLRLPKKMVAELKVEVEERKLRSLSAYVTLCLDLHEEFGDGK
jgi:Arc/MetJ-type ribon-helix-helix transcriptional regulator